MEKINSPFVQLAIRTDFWNGLCTNGEVPLYEFKPEGALSTVASCVYCKFLIFCCVFNVLMCLKVLLILSE